MSAGEGWIESESTQVPAALRRWSLGDHPVIIAARLRGRGLKPSTPSIVVVGIG
jgi:hypothetical protein